MRAWAAGALGTSVILLAVSTLPLPQRGQAAASAAAEEHTVPMVAVLPLKNDTGDEGQEHFADAMTEALIAELAREGNLRVISRTSVMPYKDPAGRRLPEIARDLNADLIIEGSVFRAGDQVRITAQLIRASTDEHVWAGTFDGQMRNIFALQRQVAQAVAGQVGSRIALQQSNARGEGRPVDAAAYEAYLQGGSPPDWGALRRSSEPSLWTRNSPPPTRHWRIDSPLRASSDRCPRTPHLGARAGLPCKHSPGTVTQQRRTVRWE